MTWELALTGLLIGLLAGVTGMGGGSLMTPVLVLVFGFNVVVAVGTDIFHAAILLWAAGLTHLWAENVDPEATGWLALGSIPGTVVGSHWTAPLPERTIPVALAAVLLLAGVKLAGVVPGF
jgi:uncharacterized membrane protein YfcA